jgi:DNA polymerase IIIc chi subunit
MATVARCSDVHEAERLKMRLAAEGIQAFIPHEVMATLAPHHFLHSAGVEIQVADKDEKKAKRLLKKWSRS